MYKEFNDYEILYMIGESSNFDILYKKYQPLIYKIMKRYEKIFKTYGYELDDLMQIGYIILYKTSFLYQEYNSSLFYTYFISALKKGIINEIRLNKTNKKESLNNSISYDNLIPNTDLRYIDVIQANNIEDDEKLNDKFVILKNTLSFTSSCVYELYYNGYSLNEISLLLDESMIAITNCIKEIRKQNKVQKYE